MTDKSSPAKLEIDVPSFHGDPITFEHDDGPPWKGEVRGPCVCIQNYSEYISLLEIEHVVLLRDWLTAWLEADHSALTESQRYVPTDDDAKS